MYIQTHKPLGAGPPPKETPVGRIAEYAIGIPAVIAAAVIVILVISGLGRGKEEDRYWEKVYLPRS